jgi:CBS domain-containing protein
MAATDHVTMQLRDRPEYASKAKPLTFPETTTVREAVAAMTERRFGSVVVVNDDGGVSGIVTERDVMTKIVDAGRAPDTTTLADVMTRDVKVARETDDVLDWLRMMSNERFRRLPVVDDNGRVTAVFTQGDFVSYTWPDLMQQASSLAKASIGRNWALVLIGGGIALYSLLMVVVVGAL